MCDRERPDDGWPRRRVLISGGTLAGGLALLADRSGIDTRPGATTSFESRGSNLHLAGVLVETTTITGHRTLSSTACPGEAGFALVRDRLPAEVTARLSPAPSTVTASSTTAGTDVAAPPTTDAGDPVAWTTTGAVGGLGAAVAGGVIALRNRRR